MTEKVEDTEDVKMGKDNLKNRPLYVISVAAELVDMHPQTLRLYERKGLIEPSRSAGKTRLYSQRDIEHLQEIRRLTQELGVNLAGRRGDHPPAPRARHSPGQDGGAHRAFAGRVAGADADVQGRAEPAR